MNSRMSRWQSLSRILGVVSLALALCCGRARAQADANLAVDSTTGDVDQNEVDTFISFMTNAGNVNANADFPTNALGDNLAYGTPGLNLEAINYMYRITGDMMATNPSLSTEHMQLMNLGIAWSENFILLRNDQKNGNHVVMWTGNVDHVWQTYATGTSEAGYAGSENGDTAGHIVFTALNILETPSIWNQTVPDGNPNGFGTTYLQRAQTYINMMEDTTQNYFTKYFINPTTFEIVPPTSPAWTVFNENMDAWNRQFLLTNDYLRLAQCHAILGDNSALQTLYTDIVKVSTNAYVANAQLATATQTVTTAFPPDEAVYDSGYGNEGDLTGQITGNSSSHTSYEFQGIARTYEAGPAYSSLTLAEMERYANTVEYAMFDYPGYPPPSAYPPFNVKLSTSYVTAYYKTIDAGLVLPTANATSDYLYGQFYFMTPYNTLFWQPAANGAAPNNHNNYHNNPYYTTGILYSKHWIFMHPQTMIAVASNSQSVTAGASATYSVTTNSTAPVALSIPDLPAGETASFSPATVAAGAGSSTLTVATSGTSLNGSQLFTLTGTSGGVVQTMGLSLVTTAPDFTVSSTGTSTVAAGSSGSWTVTVVPLNGFTGDVMLSADPNYALAGTAITFNPSTITGGSGTSVVTATTSTAIPVTPGGEWPEGFIGTSGAIVHETYSRLTVNSVPETINFPSIAGVTYGTAPLQLQASDGANLPVTYAVTGPATLTGSATLAGQTLTITGAGTIGVTASVAASSYYQAATSVTRNIIVAPASLTVAALNQSMVYGAAALPTLTTSTTGFVNADTSAVITGTPAIATTATASSPAGTYPITVGAGSLAAANYTFAFVAGTLTISKAPTATAVSASSASILPGQSVTLTASVTSAAGTPTGTVAFMNGTTTLGTATLASGVAMFTTTSLAAGSYTVTAIYAGDNNFAGSTSAASAAVAITDYTLTASPAALALTRGEGATITISLAPIAKYKGTVNLACGQLPAYVSCSFSNNAPVLDGTGTATSVLLTINTNGTTAEIVRPAMGAETRAFDAGFCLPAALLGLMLAFGARRRPFDKALRMLVLVTLSAAVLGLTACGGQLNSYSNQFAAAGSDTVTVSATGTVNHSLALTVTIQ